MLLLEEILQDCDQIESPATPDPETIDSSIHCIRLRAEAAKRVLSGMMLEVRKLDDVIVAGMALKLECDCGPATAAAERGE